MRWVIEGVPVGLGKIVEKEFFQIYDNYENAVNVG